MIASVELTIKSFDESHSMNSAWYYFKFMSKNDKDSRW